MSRDTDMGSPRDMLCDTTIIRFTTLDAKIQCAPNKYVGTREILGDGIFRKHLLHYCAVECYFNMKTMRFRVKLSLFPVDLENFRDVKNSGQITA